jgi:hypothetical protein
MFSWFRNRKLQRGSGRRASRSASAAGLCDVCNVDFDPATGFILTNREVAVSELYWEYQFNVVRAVSEELGLHADQALANFNELVEQRAADRTAWAVCEDCGGYFVFDRETARDHAVNGTTPGGGGRLPVADFIRYAALGYQRAFGHWPKNVDPRLPTGVCGFRRKDIYGPELSAGVTADALQRMCAAGALGAPVGAPETANGEHSGHLAACTSRQGRETARVNELR